MYRTDWTVIHRSVTGADIACRVLDATSLHPAGTVLRSPGRRLPNRPRLRIWPNPMNTYSRYRPAAELVVRLLPFVARHKEFALKGGTAIDFFVRAMPRLSVDIDLVWLSRAPRGTALPAMRNALARLGRDIAAGVPGIRVRAEDARDGLRLALLAHGACTKIEVNPVIRGSVWPSTVRPVHPAVEATMGYSENRLLSFDDLYAGKICAALDRQHPRDLFDIAVLLDNEGLRPSLIATFLIYLASHRRPAAELLEPNRKPIGDAYRNVFDGMALVPTSPEALADARDVVWTARGEPVLRFAAGAHHLRGNSQKISMAVAQHLGVGLDGSAKIPFAHPRGVDAASVIWRSYDPNGPEMGCIREALKATGRRPGEEVHVLLDPAGLRVLDSWPEESPDGKP